MSELAGVVRGRLVANGDWNVNDWRDVAGALLAEHDELTLELTSARDKLEHAERKLANEWPYDGTAA